MLTVKYILLLVSLTIGIFFYFKKNKSLTIKILCSAIVFIYALLGVFGISDYSTLRFLLIIGLLFCLIGDLAITFSLAVGMAVFAVAHICFISGFLTTGFFSPTIVPLIVFLILITAVLSITFKLHLAKKEIVPIACIYSALISFMTALAVCLPMHYGFRFLILAFGSVFFIISDMLLAIISSGRKYNKMDYVSFSAYYLAISLLAQGVNVL